MSEHGPHHEAETPADHARYGFAATFRERALSLPTLERPLRLIVGLAYVQIFVSIALLVLRDAQLPSIAISQDGQRSIPVPNFIVAVLAVCGAWTTVLAGGFRAGRVVRIAVVVAFTAFVALFVYFFARVGSGFVPVAVALLAVLWSALILSLVRGKPSVRIALAGAAIVVCALVGGFALAMRPSSFFAATVLGTISTMTLFVIPALVVAGAELGDWSNLAGFEIATRLGRVVRARRLTMSAVVVIAALGTWQLLDTRRYPAGLALFGQIGPFAVCACIAVSVLIASGRRRPLHHRLHVSYRTLLLAGVTISVLFYVPAFASVFGEGTTNAHQARVPGAMTEFRRSHEPGYRIAYPPKWAVVQTQKEHTPVVLFIRDPQMYFAVFARAQHSPHGSPSATPRPPLLDDVLRWDAAAGPAMREVAPPRGVDVRGARVFLHRRNGRDMAILMWRRNGDAGEYVLAGGAERSRLKEVLPVFARMRDSWTAGPGRDLRMDRGTALTVLVYLGIAVLAALRLLRRPSTAAAFWLVLAFIAALTLMYSIDLIVPSGLARWFPPLRINGIEFAVSLLSLGTLAWLAKRRALTASVVLTLLTLNIALALTRLLFELYSGAIAASTAFSVAQAVIVLVALSWDILMSGESITNGSSPTFPRDARVLLFMGYMLFVSGAVLAFSSMRLAGQPTEPVFETEKLPQQGVVMLGIPLVLTAAVVRLVSALSRTRSAADPPVPASLAESLASDPFTAEGGAG